MKELDITQRELENLREREKDARGEADGMVEAVDRARYPHVIAGVGVRALSRVLLT